MRKKRVCKFDVEEVLYYHTALTLLTRIIVQTKTSGQKFRALGAKLSIQLQEDLDVSILEDVFRAKYPSSGYFPLIIRGAQSEDRNQSLMLYTEILKG